jgi:tetratricopeptide (TPR) repeat protein
MKVAWLGLTSLPNKFHDSVSTSGVPFLRVLFVALILLPVLWSQAGAHGTHSSLMKRVDARLAESPQDGGLWYQRAVLEFEHEDYVSAAIDFAKAEKFAPGQYAVLWWQGRIFEAQGNLPEGKAALDQYLEKVPNHWGARASRARIHMKLGANAEALGDFRSALANCPDAQPDLIHEVAHALASSGHVDDAVGLLETQMQEKGQIPSLQLKLLEIEVEADRYGSALSRLEAFQKSSSRKEPWMEKRAIILAQAGAIAESHAAWSALIAHLKSLPPAERDSHAMTRLAERAHQSLAVLSVSTVSPPSPFKNFSPLQNQ